MPRRAEGTSNGLVEPDAGPDYAGMFAQLSASIGMLGQRIADMAEPQPKVPWHAVHPVPILGNITLSAGAGTLTGPDQYGPHDPYWWDVRDLSVWGFTAGTVTIYRNASGGEQMAVATAPGEFTWSNQKLLAPRDNMVFVAAGITGTVSIGGQAIEIETDWLPAYLT